MKRFLIIIGIIISTLVVAEIVARLCFHEKLTNTAMRIPVYQPDSVVNYTYIPDFHYVGHGKDFYFNKDGFIGEDFPEKSADKFRIVFSGDSWVSGSLQSIYFSTFTSCFQELWDKNGYKVEILNCGIDGKDRGYDSFKLIRYKILGLQPDMILLSYNLPFYTDNIVRESYGGYFSTYPKGHEDIHDRQKNAIDRLNKWKPFIDFIYPLYLTKATFKFLYRYAPKTHCGLRDLSMLYQNGVIRSNQKDTTATVKFTMDESVEMIHNLRDSLRENNTAFFLYDINFYPTGNVYQAAKEHKLPLIDIRVKLRERLGDFFPYDGHPTHQGNRKIAEKLFKIFIENDLIPVKYRPATD